METVRTAVIGAGNMGGFHLKTLHAGKVQGLKLAAVCDVAAERRQWARCVVGDAVPIFDAPASLLDAGVADAVLIATPHYQHPPIAAMAFARGIHVMSEKPAGVYTKQVAEMNAAAARSGRVFGIMFNHRPRPVHMKLRQIIESGELGEIRRVNWIITSWYRAQSYYDLGGWRATWAGEGGGVLVNQCPHNLDLMQWFFGMPKRVRAFCGFGRFHNIEVEDDVTAYLEYANGATGVFIASTGDMPGTNRLEIAADRGKVVLENGKLEFWRTEQSVRKFTFEYKGGFGRMDAWRCEIPAQAADGDGHEAVLRDWSRAIREGTPLIAPGAEGIRGVELSNAIHWSAWTDGWVDLPIDADGFASALKERIARSKFTPESRMGLPE